MTTRQLTVEELCHLANCCQPSEKPPGVDSINLTGLYEGADGLFVRVPPGLTAEDAQIRLETWEQLRDALANIVGIIDAEKRNESVTLNKYAKTAKSALAAAEKRP